MIASTLGDTLRRDAQGWYGTRQECESVDPATVRLYPKSGVESVDPFDLACERRWD